MITILSTRILREDNSQRLKNAGFRLIELDFIQTKSIDFVLNDVYEYLIFSSINAVESVLLNSENERLKKKRVVCVGERTQRLLQNNGFEVMLCKATAKDLAQEITKNYATGSFSYFCGNLRRDDLPKAMKTAGILYNEIEVYSTELTPHKIEEDLNAILFFSPSGVKSYSIMNSFTSEECVCIGKTTAESLPGMFDKVVFAETATEEAVTALIMKYEL